MLAAAKELRYAAGMPRPVLHDDVFRRLCRARDYLHAHHAEPLTVPELARLAGFSRFHFLRVFRDCFGATPGEYLTRVRLERAKALLAADHESVTGVCLDVGFSSLGSFSTLFAERFGCPPSAWRRHFWQVTRAEQGSGALFIPWCFYGQYGGPQPPVAEGRLTRQDV